MKFKKEDMGLYFALGLVGAGAGLLIGALIAARLMGPEPIYIPEMDEEEWDQEAEMEAHKTIQKIARVKKSQKQGLTKEMEEFIITYQPTAIQIEMVKNNLLTLDDLKDVLVLEKVAEQQEPYNYNTVYLEKDDKPDLDELAQLPDEIEIIEERWQISSEQTEAKSKRNLRRVFYDAFDDEFFTLSRQDHPIPVGSINDYIPNEVWEVVEPYLMSDMGPIFVNDLETTKHFKFEVVPEDTEDSSADDAVS
ncbi:MAG: hypothetical protein KAV87_26970 [Desulfobacteraceae bacterium]|nr:hypothetical protein [Desulfobacteraceae bacterium]